MAKGLSTGDYLAQHHILTYVQDAVTQLLVYKGDMHPSKVEVNRFLAQYFTCLKAGQHTLFREYEFINSTPFNRACFVQTFLKCFAVIGKKGDLLTIREYYALVSILCNDFPYEVLQKTAKIVLIDDAHDCLIAFTDFVYSFQLQLCYQEFLETANHIYQSLLTENQSPRDIVVPTDQTTQVHKEKQPTHHNADGVDSMKFYRLLSQLPDKHRFSIPSLSALREILSTTPTVTFYDFLVALSKSEAINTGIGRLPPMAQIFDDVNISFDFTFAPSGNRPSVSGTSNHLRGIQSSSLSEPVITTPPSKPASAAAEVKPNSNDLVLPRENGLSRQNVARSNPQQMASKGRRAAAASRRQRRLSSDTSSDESSSTDTN